MSKKYTNLSDIADYFELDDGDSVKTLIDELHNYPDVYDKYDEYMGLSSDLSEEFQNTPIYEADELYDQGGYQDNKDYERMVEVCNDFIEILEEPEQDDDE
ncbi:hypothetical protein ABWE99_10735 [Pasteurella multocida]|uniref:hypothetical protein n=1 Tax=Pasteurella multocida TaxID=747 RepID=UPI0020207952|nr:hypothetical protein [Pasteurella multocida]MCL7795936.1 hypothetical protein [Pasteurella multocida]